MANILTGNPWVLDTASATPIVTYRVRIGQIEWIGGTNAGHVAEMKDGAGNVVYRAEAGGGNNEDVRLRHGKATDSFVGLALTTIDSGKVYVTLR